MGFILIYFWVCFFPIYGHQAAVYAYPKKPKSTEALLEFRFQFKDKPLNLHQSYVMEDGSTLIFTKIQFYVGQLSLQDKDKNTLKAKDDFYFVRLEEDTDKARICLGEQAKRSMFTKLAFGIGIDSLGNHQGKQEGALDPLHGMFWTWAQGYVFFKIEGYYQSSAQTKGGFIYHIGGDACYRSLQMTASPYKEGNDWIYPIKLGLERLFGDYPNPAIQLKIPQDTQKISVMGGPQAALIADNFKEVFMPVSE